MKKQILCLECGGGKTDFFPAQAWDSAWATQADYARAEWALFVTGGLVADCVCDLCGRPMEPGEAVYAVSEWPRGQYPGKVEIGWERDYLRKPQFATPSDPKQEREIEKIREECGLDDDDEPPRGPGFRWGLP